MAFGAALLMVPSTGLAGDGRGGDGHRRDRGARVERLQQQQARAERRQDRAERRQARAERQQDRAGRQQARAERRAQHARAERQEARAERQAQQQARLERRQARAEWRAEQQARAERQQARAERRAQARVERDDDRERRIERLSQQRREAARAHEQQRAAQQRELRRQQAQAARAAERAEQRARAEQQRELRAARQVEREQRRLADGAWRERQVWRDADRRAERRRERQLAAAERRAVAPLRRGFPGPTRFRGLDRNGDGIVTRAEWLGNDVSFRNHDWNGDGVLSGAEVVPGASRRDRWVARDRFDRFERDRFARDGRLVVDDGFADRRAGRRFPERFFGETFRGSRVDRALQRERERLVWDRLTAEERRYLAQNPIPHHDGRAMEVRQSIVAAAEGRPWYVPEAYWSWRQERTLRDRVVMAPVRFTPLPRLDEVVVFDLDEDLFEERLRHRDFTPLDLVLRGLDPRPVDRVLLVDRFAVLDRDRDQYVSWREWPGQRSAFVALDGDGDSRLVLNDLLAGGSDLDPILAVDRERYVAFHLLDVDDDGVLMPWEWTGDLDTFFLVDSNDDGRVELSESLGLTRVRPVPLRRVVRRDLDLDGDGVVTRVDWIGDPFRFARLDLDADGEIEVHEALIGWMMRA